MIGDAKYKGRPQEEDRYQIITHGLSYGVKNVILIYPRRESQAEGGLQVLGNIGVAGRSIKVHEYFFDLAGNLDKEEEALRSAAIEIMT